MKIKKPNKKQEPAFSRKPSFSRGYDDVRKRVEKGSRYTMSCYNCDFYYQASGDMEEVCQNPDVLKYDMTVTDTSIYCNRWVISRRSSTAKSIFKKDGNK